MYVSLATLRVGEVEEVVRIVPGELVHLKFKLLLMANLLAPHVDEGD